MREKVGGLVMREGGRMWEVDALGRCLGLLFWFLVSIWKDGGGAVHSGCYVILISHCA